MAYNYEIKIDNPNDRGHLIIMFYWWLTHFVPIARKNNLIKSARLDKEIDLVEIMKMQAEKNKHNFYLKDTRIEAEMCNVIADYIGDSDIMNNKKNIKIKLMLRDLGIDIYKDTQHWHMLKYVKEQKDHK